jgi:hypothetical protein
MEIANLVIANDTYVGSPDLYRKIQLPTKYLFAASDMNTINECALSHLGKMASTNFSFLGETWEIENLLAHNKERAKGILLPEETQWLRLLERVKRDLGSINIDSAIAEVSQEGKVLMLIRIEASEGNRRRVVKLGEQSGPIDTVAPHILIDAIEAKF